MPVIRICENLGIDPRTQREKVQKDKKFAAGVIPLRGLDGRNRGMVCIPENRVAAFLFTINSNRVADHLKDKLEVYQEKLADAIHEWATAGLIPNKHHPANLITTEFYQRLADQSRIQDQIVEQVNNHQLEIDQVKEDIEEIREVRKEKLGNHLLLPNEITWIDKQIKLGNEPNVKKARQHLEDLMKFAGEHHIRYSYGSVWMALKQELYTTKRKRIYKTDNENYMDQIV